MILKLVGDKIDAKKGIEKRSVVIKYAELLNLGNAPVCNLSIEKENMNKLEEKTHLPKRKYE